MTQKQLDATMGHYFRAWVDKEISKQEFHGLVDGLAAVLRREAAANAVEHAADKQ